MAAFNVADLAKSPAILCDRRLEFEHFALTAMDGGNAKELPGAILAQLIPPRINQRFLKS